MSTKPPLLMLAQRIPFPPDKGEKIRSYHILKHLQQRFDVHLGTCLDDPADEAHVASLAAMVSSLHVARISKLRGLTRAALRWLVGEPLSFGYFHDQSLIRWVGETLDAVKPQVALCYSSNIAPALFCQPRMPPKVVCDFVDVDSQKWRDYAPTKGLATRWIFTSEARRTHRAEARLGARSTHVTFVSADEAKLFRSLHPELSEKTGHFANGVDLDFFTPDVPCAVPDGMIDQALVFTGRMDYWPNVEAADWLVREILPRVRARLPEVQVWIVGAAPTDAVRQLATTSGVHVTGRVPDVRAYVRHGLLAVAPMRIARGIQNKVLEALAMGRPTLVSPEALTGIHAPDGEAVVVAQSAEDWAEKIVALAGSHTRQTLLGAAARTFVEQNFSWPAQLAILDRYLA